MSVSEHRLLSLLTTSFASQCINLVKLHCQTEITGTESTDDGPPASPISCMQDNSTMSTNIGVTDLTDRPETFRMAETTPAKVSTEPDSKYTKNTKLWWQAKTGWSDDEYAYRRNAVYNKIREKWPEEKLLNGRDGNGTRVKQDIRDWLRPLVISFNDHNWPYGATLDRVERQLQPYVSWALYLNRHPPTLNMPTIATSATAATVANTANTAASTPSLPSYSFVTPDQHNVSASKSRVSINTAPTDYWSETSSEDESTAPPIGPRHPTGSIRKSESVVTQSPSTAGHFDWDNVEVQIDVRIFDQDYVWLPMYDLKPAPKHLLSHWADFRLLDLYNQLSTELSVDIDQNKYQFAYLNQPGCFPFRREGAYRIALKRFAQMGAADQILRLRLEKTPQTASSGINYSGGVTNQRTPQQPSRQSSTVSKRPSELTQPQSKPILTSDVRAPSANTHRPSLNGNRSLENVGERPSKRPRLPSHDSRQSVSRGTTHSNTPASVNQFTAVNSPPIDTAALLAKFQQQTDARSVMFSDSEPSDPVEQEMTQPSDQETPQSDSVVLVKMEGAG